MPSPHAKRTRSITSPHVRNAPCMQKAATETRRRFLLIHIYAKHSVTRFGTIRTCAPLVHRARKARVVGAYELFDFEPQRRLIGTLRCEKLGRLAHVFLGVA